MQSNRFAIIIHMAKMKINPPQLPTLLYEADPVVSDDVALEACRLTKVDLRGRVARTVRLDEVLLDKVVLAEAKFKKLTGHDIVLKDCDVSAMQCAEASLQRASVTGSRLTGLDCSKGAFKDVLFRDCKVDMANFRYTNL